MPRIQRFPTRFLAPIALAASTLGCGSGSTDTTLATPASPEVVVTAPPVVIDDAKPVVTPEPRISDEIRQVSGTVEGQVNDAEGRVTRAVGEVKDRVHQTQGVVESLPGQAKKAVGDAEKDARLRAKKLKDGVEKAGKELEKDVLDGFLPPR